MRKPLSTASVSSMLAALCLMTASAGAATVRLQVGARPPANLPMELSGELAAALTTGDGAPASNLGFHVRGPRGVCLSQSLPGAGGTTTLAWQTPATGKYEIALESAERRGAKDTGREEKPIAKDDGGMVRIHNGVLSAAHIAAVGGGFPVEIAVAGVRTPLKFEFADRLYHPDVGQFSFASNPKPVVRLIANGPLFATVEVGGGYYRLETGQWVQHIAKPLARYRFTYYRDCPLVRVEATVTQEGVFAWKELHVLELRPVVGRVAPRPEGTDVASVESAPALVPKSWAGARPTEEGMVTGATGSKTFDRWAAIYFENGVAALLNPRGAGQQARRARFYDDKSLLYLCGPWVEFAGPSAEFSAHLYFGPRNTPRQTLEEVAAQIDQRTSPRVELPAIEEQAKTLRQKTVSALPGFGNRTARAVRLWQIQHALADVHALRNVAAARRLLGQKAPSRTLPRETPPPVEIVSLGGGRDAVVTDQLLLAFDAKGRLTSFHQTLSNTEL
ncbi:MAG: hypothetical protein FJ388_18265, partial [Verrucomicrobia bacterium]|nr:hypothetical protein [Verrucomicrobiota bacterium]